MSNKKKRDQKRRERARRRFGITAPETVPVENSVTSGSVCSTEESHASEKELKARIAKLERELEDARLMRDFYDEMINIAEKDFNIPIRKKGGAKR